MISQTTHVFAPAPAQAVEPERVSDARSLPGIIELWRESLRTFSAHSAPILACALLGLVGAGLVGALVNAALTLGIYVQTGGIFSNAANIFYAQLLAQAAIGVFAISLARGAITWIALHDGSTLRAALRASAARWPLLLLSALIYGAFITLGIAGLSLLLRQLRLDLTSVARVSGDYDSIIRIITARAINTVIPDPGSPFTELINYARYLLRRASTNYYWLYAYRYTIGDVSMRLWLIAAASLIPLLLAGTLLRLRAAAIMSWPQPNRLAALFEAIRLGAQHFRYIAAHGTVVWLAGSAINIVFSIVPLTLAQYLLVPLFSRQVNGLWPYPVSTLVFSIGASLVTMVFLAFGAVYDARLHAAITRAKT